MTQVYPICISTELEGLCSLEEAFEPVLVRASEQQVLPQFRGVFESLVQEKGRIEEDVAGYRSARDRLLGDLKDAKQSRTRAGRKFEEISAHTALISESQVSASSIVVDLCGAPGAFSLVLQKTFPTLEIIGFSLKAGIPWFEDLTKDNFRLVYGADDDGNLYSAANRKSLHMEISNRPCVLIVADGGFEEISDLQEQVLSRLILAECSVCLTCLAEGGTFVCKLFDTFTEFSRSLLYILARLFRSVSVVKPASSRAVNSERYLVCLHFVPGQVAAVERSLEALGLADQTGTVVQTLVHPEIVGKDRKFLDSFEVMTLDLATRQTAALRRVLDERDKRKHKRRKGL